VPGAAVQRWTRWWARSVAPPEAAGLSPPPPEAPLEPPPQPGEAAPAGAEAPTAIVAPTATPAIAALLRMRSKPFSFLGLRG
jgi:hypothetical protein